MGRTRCQPDGYVDRGTDSAQGEGRERDSRSCGSVASVATLAHCRDEKDDGERPDATANQHPAKTDEWTVAEEVATMRVLRVLVLARDDPSIPVYLSRVVRRRDTDVVAVVAVGTARKLSSLRYLWERMRVRGVRAFLLKGLQMGLYRVLDRIDGTIGLQGFTTVLGIPLRRVRNIKSKTFLDWVRDLHPDVILSVTCPKIIGKELLDIPPLGCINMHCAVLPDGRGRDPAFWSLYRGHKWTAVTVHYMDEEMDNGEILAQDMLEIRDSDTVESLYQQIAEVGAGTIARVLDCIGTGRERRLPNDKGKATWFGVPTRRDVRELGKRGKSLIGLWDCWGVVRRR